MKAIVHHEYGSPDVLGLHEVDKPFHRRSHGSTSLIPRSGCGGLREHLDWRPFDYFTTRWTPLPNGFEIMPPAIETYEFTPIGDHGTSIRWRIRTQDRSEPTMRQFELVANVIREAASSPEWGQDLRKALAEDAASLAVDDADKPQDRSD